MKRTKILSISLLAVMISSAASCGEKANNPALLPAVTSEIQTEPETIPETTGQPDEIPEPVEDVSFKTGLWEGFDCFYYFNDDNSGSTSSYKNQTGIAFTYEVTGGRNVVFHMGAAEDYTPAMVEMADDFAVIVWENDTETRLNYLEGYTEYDYLNFCPDEQLLEMAKNAYTNATGIYPTKATISGNNGLYAPVAIYVDGEKVEEYSVNRCTLSGTSLTTGEEVFLYY